MYQLPYTGKVKIACPFGKPGTWKAGWHVGLDLVGQDNKNIRPIAAGAVESISAHGSAYGNHVVIKHYDGNVSLYAHLSRVLVQKGQAVYPDTIIGTEGQTGNATGSHLHLEIHKGEYKYPPTGNSPAKCPWLVNPAEALGIKNEVGEVIKLAELASPWAKDAQAWVVKTGISDGLRPREDMTREEMWVMLFRFKHLLDK